MIGQMRSCSNLLSLSGGKHGGARRVIVLYAVGVIVALGASSILKLVETYVCFHPVITEILASPLRFTNKTPLDIAAMYFAPMVSVFLGSLFLAGPLISTSYLVAAWAGANAVERLTSAVEMTGDASPLFGGSTIADPSWVQYIVPVVCCVLLGWVMQRRT
jgi:hypothetical protein